MVSPASLTEGKNKMGKWELNILFFIFRKVQDCSLAKISGAGPAVTIFREN